MPCLQDAYPCVDQACCADSPNQNQGLQGNPKHWQTLLLKPKMNLRDDHTIMETTACQDKAVRSNSHAAQIGSPQVVVPTQSSEMCKCKKTSSETQDAGTQTANNPMVETCDASSQCNPVMNSVASATEFNLCSPPVDVSVQPPATGR